MVHASCCGRALQRLLRLRVRALVVVDIGPEISDAGRNAIAGFVRANEEFNDLEHFIENVRKYDPYRKREHIERTVKYNMLVRSDGKYISKCDGTARRLGIRPSLPQDTLTLDDAATLNLPVLVVRGADSNILAPDAAERFRDDESGQWLRVWFNPASGERRYQPDDPPRP